jgi:hypothetical protein
MAHFLWDLLGSWVFVGVVVPLGIGIGIGVLSMTPPAFSIAKVCFSISALVLSIGIGQWLMSSDFSIRDRLILGCAIFGIIGTLWVESFRWMHGREGSFGQHKDIYHVNFLTTMNMKWPGPLLSVYASPLGKTISPVSIAIYIEVVNKKPTISRIYDYECRALLEYDEGGHQNINILPNNSLKVEYIPSGKIVEKWRTLYDIGFLDDQIYYVIDNDWTKTKRIDFTQNSFDVLARNTQFHHHTLFFY